MSSLPPISNDSTQSGDIQLVNGLPIPTRQTRKRIVYNTLIFCALVIIGTTVWGNPSNTLHQSAQSWAFGMSFATIFAYVFGAVADNFNLMRTSASTNQAIKK